MEVLNHIRLMADYNQQLNKQVCEAAGMLNHESLVEHRGAFFGSVLGTLNHLIVGDLIWLKRFAGHPAQHVSLNPIRATEAPATLEQQLFSTMEGLWQERQILDAVIVSWSRELKADDLDHCLEYSNMKGVLSRRHTGALIMHFFNHQTHHRGQLSTLLYQQGFDIGLTDLLYFIPEES